MRNDSNTATKENADSILNDLSRKIEEYQDRICRLEEDISSLKLQETEKQIALQIAKKEIEILQNEASTTKSDLEKIPNLISLNYKPPIDTFTDTLSKVALTINSTLRKKAYICFARQKGKTLDANLKNFITTISNDLRKGGIGKIYADIGNSATRSTRNIIGQHINESDVYIILETNRFASAIKEQYISNNLIFELDRIEQSKNKKIIVLLLEVTSDLLENSKWKLQSTIYDFSSDYAGPETKGKTYFNSFIGYKPIKGIIPLIYDIDSSDTYKKLVDNCVNNN